MKKEPSEQSAKNLQRRWFLMAALFCIALALFWSVDTSFIYLFTAGAVFCFFRMLQFRQRNEAGPQEEHYAYREKPKQENSSVASSPLFEQLLGFIERNQISKQRIILVLVAGFFGFFIFLTIVGVLLDSGSGELSYENTLRASDYYSQGQYDSAAYYYQQALTDDPQNADLWYGRGNAFLNGGKPDSALVMFEQALVYRPNFTEAQYNKAIIFYNRKSYRDAIEETKKVFVYNPDYLDGKLLIGDCFYNQSQLDSALGWYEQAYETGYRSAVLCHLMAYIYDVKGQTAPAIDLYKEAIGQDSSIVDIYTRLGELMPGDDGSWYRQKALALQNQNQN